MLALREAGTPLHELVWSFAPRDYATPRTTADWQSQTPESMALSKRLKSAGFRVLKAPDVPSVLVELGYVSNKGDLEHLVSDSWRAKTAGSMALAIDAFFAKRLATAGAVK